MNLSYEQLPTLYHSPTGAGESGDYEAGSLSRGSTSSTTHLMSPIGDLAEAVNTITDDYASDLFEGIDWSATDHPHSPFKAKLVDPYQDARDYQGQNAFGATRDIGNGAGGPSSFGMPSSGMFDNMYPDVKPDTDTLDFDPKSPFAHMPTHLLQQYLINAGALQQYQVSGGPGTQQAVSPANTLFQNASAMNVDALSGLGPHNTRSPSPLVEMDDMDDDQSLNPPSPDTSDDAPSRPSRRASDGSVARPASRRTSTRRLSAHLPVEEKMLRAQATEGLSKPDKRRVQNKLAQRAFRARSKVANRNVFSRLEHLEELTEQQANRIVKMTDLVSRLQKENTGLKATKFEAAMQALAQQPQQQQR